MMASIVALLFFIIVGCAAFLGVYRDREHLDHHLFLKHRATSEWFFWSPVGESDKGVEALTVPEKSAEKLYKEFVEEGNGYKRSFPIFLW